MRKDMILRIAAIGLLLTSMSFAAEVNKGAKEETIPAGSQGDVKFPHELHQQSIQDCKLCHDLYPETPNAISGLKQKGALKPKQVMNQQCVKCHNAKRAAGVKAGPVICSQCHGKHS